MTTDPRFTPVLLTLPSFTPSLALEVLPHGVTFHRLYVQADGKVYFCASSFYSLAHRRPIDS